MTRKELIKFCLTMPGVYEDYPFNDDNWAVIRHRKNSKIFAWIYCRNQKLCINVKEEPMQAKFWRKMYRGVEAGYHLNKEHWNTITVDMDVPLQELYGMIKNSYRLTSPRQPVKSRKGQEDTAE
ncbi:MAG: MmcQ/YjbR family DNA-binding protein [Oscillospiraceae bacterium]